MSDGGAYLSVGVVVQGRELQTEPIALGLLAWDAQCQESLLAGLDREAKHLSSVVRRIAGVQCRVG